MVELLLFLGTFGILFFIPVQFRIYYQKIAWDDSLILEMSFLNGLLKRRKVVSLFQLKPQTIKKREKFYGRWFFIKKAYIKNIESPYQGNSRGLREFLQRYQHFGVGLTLLTYFLPAKYQHWLLVTEDLEKRGYFTKFTWITRFGTGNPVGTATLYGLLWAVKSSSISFLHHKAGFRVKPEIKVIADFEKVRLDMIFDCIFHVKLGYIIIAALIARFRHRLLKGGIGVGESSN